jgi:RNA polymerase sigma-70 factor (ECF subfamily)
MTGSGPGEVFARIVVPHLPAAYRLALWLLRDKAAAEDVVQDAAERAFRHIATFRGDNACAWVLRIVRNQAVETLKKIRPTAELDEDLPDQAPLPDADLVRAEGEITLQAALAALPPTLRECLVMRELEELSYRDIADIVGVPVGTVMSRLWRARQLLLAQTEVFRA